MTIEHATLERAEPSLSDKVAFLSEGAAYGLASGKVAAIETHMSWVFLAGDKVFKLKKPVRFSYLDFSTLARREAACRAELALNRRLAPSVYLDVAPLCSSERGLAIGGGGRIADWLVVMRRLDQDKMLDRAIETRRVDRHRIDAVAQVLARFYRGARRPLPPPAAYLLDWRKNLTANRSILLDPRFDLPAGLIRRIDLVQRRFLAERGELILRRVRKRRILDGHGDLRPEHIWLGEPLQIIDCLEFNPRLRAVDPFDEIAYLGLECERLGAPWIGGHILRRLRLAMHDDAGPELFSFYRCYRAMLRARLAIAHLIEPSVRTPEKWPRRAREYLRIAARDAARLERCLRTPANRPKRGPRAGGGSSRRTGRL